jgi:hypothetical protein
MSLVMTPAAYHRIAERGRISTRFTELASWFIAAAMVPLALSIPLETFVVTVITTNSLVGGFVGAFLAVMFVAMWFVWPMVDARRRWLEDVQLVLAGRSAAGRGVPGAYGAYGGDQALRPTQAQRRRKRCAVPGAFVAAGDLAERVCLSQKLGNELIYRRAAIAAHDAPIHRRRRFGAMLNFYYDLA